MYKLISDGACLGNPGVSAAGFVIKDPDNREIFKGGVFLGKGTNNTAEYHAIIEGLETASGMEIDRLKVYTDSELVVNQICGSYKVKSATLKPLKDKVIEQKKKFKVIEFLHLSRQKTSEAHDMAEGMVKKK